LAHAGHRCEHHAPLLGRCRQTERLEADHIHPWSRGGQTAVANGQALCRRHNREKRAAVPFGRQLRSLEKRRAEYYPPGVSGAVTRHAPPPPRLPKRPARRTPTA
jgi:5-methylcytosine-specific restriction endonuclease McrA